MDQGAWRTLPSWLVPGLPFPAIPLGSVWILTVLAMETMHCQWFEGAMSLGRGEGNTSWGLYSNTTLFKERVRNEFCHIRSLTGTRFFSNFNGHLTETLFCFTVLKVKVKSEPKRQPSPGERKRWDLDKEPFRSPRAPWMTLPLVFSTKMWRGEEAKPRRLGNSGPAWVDSLPLVLLRWPTVRSNLSVPCYEGNERSTVESINDPLEIKVLYIYIHICVCVCVCACRTWRLPHRNSKVRSRVSCKECILSN